MRKLNEYYQRLPVTSEESFKERKKAKVSIQKRNKQRAKDMERRIAKLLAGQRTPMSGAGFMKGDIRVPFKHKHFMIECKLSSQINVGNHDPYITLVFEWFTKMEKEANAMGSLFPVLIVHLMRYEEDYCFIPLEAWNQWFIRTEQAAIKIEMSLMRKITRRQLQELLPFSVVLINTKQYVVLELQELKKMVDAHA
jgi:hypothetical protein